ncbi:nucleotidyltransferase, partial [Candidatus Micrarchaeota archaeon CG10_big_fil_rev_8_21_14_0_10_59_7]
MRDQIMGHFKDGKRYGVNIKYAEEEEELGTAGSVLNAQPLVKDEDFLVLMGDQLTSVSLKKLMSYHKEKKAIATVGLKRMGVPLQFG